MLKRILKGKRALQNKDKECKIWQFETKRINEGGMFAGEILYIMLSSSSFLYGVCIKYEPHMTATHSTYDILYILKQKYCVHSNPMLCGGYCFFILCKGKIQIKNEYELLIIEKI